MVHSRGVREGTWKQPRSRAFSNPTVELIARLIFTHARQQGFHVVKVRVWETPTSFATYQGE